MHARPYRETSVLLEVLTEEFGRFGAVVRGVRSAKPRIARGTVRPLIALQISGALRGELAQIHQIEQVDQPRAFDASQSQALLYLNELLVRLLPRQDPHTTVFHRYVNLLQSLSTDANAMAWQLRWFERDLLIECGYALSLAYEQEADGESEIAIDPDAFYHFDPRLGARRVPRTQNAACVRGASLLALAGLHEPTLEAVRECKRLMRGILLHHLDGRPLNAWRVLRSAAKPESPEEA